MQGSDRNVRKKYNNILQCEQNFTEMQQACKTLNMAVGQMHELFLQLDSDCLTEIQVEVPHHLTVILQLDKFVANLQDTISLAQSNLDREELSF